MQDPGEIWGYKRQNTSPEHLAAPSISPLLPPSVLVRRLVGLTLWGWEEPPRAITGLGGSGNIREKVKERDRVTGSERERGEGGEREGGPF